MESHGLLEKGRGTNPARRWAGTHLHRLWPAMPFWPYHSRTLTKRHDKLAKDGLLSSYVLGDVGRLHVWPAPSRFDASSLFSNPSHRHYERLLCLPV